MSDWHGVTNKRYVPTWQTHPAEWRMSRMELIGEQSICGCGHELNWHFRDPHLDFIFCLIETCECVEDNPNFVGLEDSGG